MISNFINQALRNGMVVLLVAVSVAGYGFYSNNNTKVDTIPYLSKNQVIIFTEWMGRSLRIMEDQKNQ